MNRVRKHCTIYIYPPPRLRECDRDDGWYPGTCISICITKFLASLRSSYDFLASLRSTSAANASIMNATTASPYDHDKTLNFGYISQSRRYAFPPKIQTAKNIQKPNQETYYYYDQRRSLQCCSYWRRHNICKRFGIAATHIAKPFSMANGSIQAPLHPTRRRLK